METDKIRILKNRILTVFLVLMLVFWLTSIIRAEEASRSVAELKGEKTASPAPAEKVDSLQTPAPNVEKTEKTPEVKTTPEPKLSPSAGEDEKLDLLAPVDENTPAGWDEEKSFDDEWKLDPERGKPKINVGLTIFYLVMVSLIAYGALKLYSMYVGSDQNVGGFGKKMLKIRERQMIAPNKQICLVEIPGKIVLIGVSENDMKILTEIDPEQIKDMSLPTDSGPAPESPASYFTNILLGKRQQEKTDNQEKS
ncbi:MAG: flagellar biosynthetic protein FliO [Vulcanimicrobiota bacterium]